LIGHGIGKAKAMAPKVSIESDAVSSLGRAGHDIGLGALIGGNLFGRVAMHPALSEVSDERERGKVLNRSWRRYGPVNGIALGTVIAGWLGARLGEARPAMLSERERRLALAKDAAVGAVAVTGLAAMVGGMRFSGTAPGGAVPMETGEQPSEQATPEAARLKGTLKVLSSLHLASALTLAGVNAALGQENFRRPPKRRLLKRRF
jgi:hypothetical protein